MPFFVSWNIWFVIWEIEIGNEYTWWECSKDWFVELSKWQWNWWLSFIATPEIFGNDQPNRQLTKKWRLNHRRQSTSSSPVRKNSFKISNSPRGASAACLVILLYYCNENNSLLSKISKCEIFDPVRYWSTRWWYVPCFKGVCKGSVNLSLVVKFNWIAVCFWLSVLSIFIFSVRNQNTVPGPICHYETFLFLFQQREAGRHI